MRHATEWALQMRAGGDMRRVDPTTRTTSDDPAIPTGHGAAVVTLGVDQDGFNAFMCCTVHSVRIFDLEYSE